MGDVFICHSRHDLGLKSYMNEICALTNARAREFEFDYSALGGIANEEIVTIMKECSVLFVLLGSEVLKSLHTSNWVSSEVGLAKAMNIPIWVMEDWWAPVDFPVPFVDHYIRINVGDPANRPPEHHSWMQGLLNLYGAHRPRSGDIKLPSLDLLQCGNPRCRAIFGVHQPSEEILKCPVCTSPGTGEALTQPPLP